MKQLSAWLVLMVLFVMAGCEEQISSSDPDYPTIINEPASREKSTLIDQLDQTPFRDCTAIDNFGFPFLILNNEGCIDFEQQAMLSIDSMKMMIADALHYHGTLFNILSDSTIAIKQITSIKGESYEEFLADFPDSAPPAWLITSEAQKYKGLEVRGTELRFLLTPDGVTGIQGHWYYPILIPSVDNFSIEQAQTHLYNQKFTYNRTELIPNAEMAWKDFHKIIVPVKFSRTIELRVCWAIYVESWELVVDTQTGEVLSAININAL